MALRLTSLPPNYNISIARTAESARYSLAEPPLAQRITDSAYDQNPFARRTQHKNLHVNLCHYSVLAPQCTSTGPLQTLCQDCDAHRCRLRHSGRPAATHSFRSRHGFPQQVLEVACHR
jgi:hypothetical protein